MGDEEHLDDMIQYKKDIDEFLNTYLGNHLSDIDRRIKRLEKLIFVAIATNLPTLIRILLSL